MNEIPVGKFATDNLHINQLLFGWLDGCVLRPIDNEVILIETAPPFTVHCEGREARF